MEHVDPLVGIILPYVNFAIFIGLAIYFFKSPIRNATKQRHEAFKAALEEADRARLDAEKRLGDLNARISNLDQEITEIKSLGEKTATAEAEKIIADARGLAERIREEAIKVGVAEVAKARAGLRDEIVRSVHEAVENNIKTELSEDKHLDYTRKKISGLREIKVEG